MQNGQKIHVKRDKAYLLQVYFGKYEQFHCDEVVHVNNTFSYEILVIDFYTWKMSHRL